MGERGYRGCRCREVAERGAKGYKGKFSTVVKVM